MNDGTPVPFVEISVGDSRLGVLAPTINTCKPEQIKGPLVMERCKGRKHQGAMIGKALG